MPINQKEKYFEKHPFITLISTVIVGIGAIMIVWEWMCHQIYGEKMRPLTSTSYLLEEDHFEGLMPEFVQKTIRLPGRVFESDSSIYGCRHPDEIDRLRLNQGKMRMLFLGDSFTLGWGVKNIETYGSLLGQYSGTSSDNLICGQAGTSIVLHEKQLSRVLKKEKNLQFLVYQICGNDIIGAYIEEDPVRRAIYPQSRLPLISFLRQIDFRIIPPVWNLHKNHKGRLSMKMDYRVAPEIIFPHYGPILREDILSQKDLEILNQAKILYQQKAKDFISSVKNLGIKTAVVLIPYGEGFPNERQRSVYESIEIDPQKVQSIRSFFRETYADPDIIFIDLYDAFQQAYQKNPHIKLFLGDMHLNQRGNQLAAETIYQYLKPRGWFSKNGENHE